MADNIKHIDPTNKAVNVTEITVDQGKSPHLPKVTFELINEFQRRLQAGESFNNPKVTSLATDILGGTRLQGIYTPRDAYDAIEVAINRLLLEGEAKALMEMSDPNLGLTYFLRPLLKQLPRQADRTLEQQLLQQFSTPPTLAFVAARVLAPRKEDVVMEPSAGTASLAIWPAAIGAQVITNEISPRRRALLELLGFSTLGLDGEILDDLLPADIRPTAFLTNPPFSATGGRVARNNTLYGARHIETDLKRVETGGRLVAVVGQGMGMEKPAFSEWWKLIASRYTVRANLSLPGDEYARFGTTLSSNSLSNFTYKGPCDKLRAPKIRTEEHAKNCTCNTYMTNLLNGEKYQSRGRVLPRRLSNCMQPCLGIMIPLNARMTLLTSRNLFVKRWLMPALKEHIKIEKMAELN